jgi:hypothetical protein
MASNSYYEQSPVRTAIMNNLLFEARWRFILDIGEVKDGDNPTGCTNDYFGFEQLL